jgi:squalene-associated FAD-dependent desaturase
MTAMTPLEHPVPATLASPMRVIVIGGGLAGMAAAVALESAGAIVTLIESRRSLGGRAGSFQDPQSGEELDNCQHVLLGCCTNLLDLYDRLGVRHLIRFERKVHFRDGAGKRFDLVGMRGLPAPMHLGASFAFFGALNWRERLAYSRAMLAMLRLGRRGRKSLADISFGQWLDDHHQPASLVEKMYDPVLVGALNEQCRLASAEYAIQVFQDAMLAHAGGYVMGLPACPLGQLYEKLPCRDVRLGTRVGELRFNGDQVAGVTLTNGEELNADVVVLATNHHAVRRWIPEHLAERDERFRHLDQIESVPILGVHLWFDRPVMTDSHTALITGPLQWLFRKDERGLVLHGVISAAREWVNRPKEECLQLFERQVRSVLPGAAEAKLVRGVIVIEKRATFSPVPGIDRLRPAQAPPMGGIENLFLAGDYTKTGWPATMEGAVRSGYLAAEAVLKKAGMVGSSFLVADLKAQWPARVLGMGE